MVTACGELSEGGVISHGPRSGPTEARRGAGPTSFGSRARGTLPLPANPSSTSRTGRHDHHLGLRVPPADRRRSATEAEARSGGEGAFSWYVPLPAGRLTTDDRRR